MRNKLIAIDSIKMLFQRLGIGLDIYVTDDPEYFVSLEGDSVYIELPSGTEVTELQLYIKTRLGNVANSINTADDLVNEFDNALHRYFTKPLEKSIRKQLKNAQRNLPEIMPKELIHTKTSKGSSIDRTKVEFMLRKKQTREVGSHQMLCDNFTSHPYCAFTLEANLKEATNYKAGFALGGAEGSAYRMVFSQAVPLNVISQMFDLTENSEEFHDKFLFAMVSLDFEDFFSYFLETLNNLLSESQLVTTS